MDSAKVEKDWRSRGFSCGLWTDKPGQVWADFVHDVEGNKCEPAAIGRKFDVEQVGG